VQASTLLGNDYDVDGNALTLTGTSSASGGSVRMNATTKTITFIPAANYSGPAGFNYTISDGTMSSTAHASFNVVAVDDPASVGNDSFSGTEDLPLHMSKATLLANDYDIDSAPAIASVTSLVGGTVAISGAEVVYTPIHNFYGHAQYSYSLTDGGVGYVDINVKQVDDARDDVNTIEELYTAMFNRPADVAGLNNAVLLFNGQALPGGTPPAHPRTVQEQADEMAMSPEFHHLYDGKSANQIVTAIYNNLFGRDPLTAGLTFWSNAINNHSISVAKAFIDIFNSASAPDKAIAVNKVMAAEYFTYYMNTPAEKAGYIGAHAIAVANTYMNSVTTDDSLFQARLNVHTTIADATGAAAGSPLGGAHVASTEQWVTLTGVAPHVMGEML
jgi:hypothetical protein